MPQAAQKPTRITSLEDILSLMRSPEADFSVFRGENRTSYVLRPKIGRYAQSDEVSSEPGRDSTEVSLLRVFKNAALPFLQQPPSTALDWMALAQHHGLATRLLDWSENLLVATYFAVEDHEADHDRVLYALNIKGLDFLEHHVDPFETQREVAMFEPKHLSSRITAQRGIFSVHRTPQTAFSTRLLRRYIIDSSAVHNLNFDLDRMGFNAATLFPGFDGIARHLNETRLSPRPAGAA